MVDRDKYMYPDLIRHCDNVVRVCNLFYNGRLKDELIRAAEIHDIGKYFISPVVLNAPRGLTIPERMAIDMHSSLGYYEAKQQGEDELICQLIVLHHGIGKVGIPSILSMLIPDAVEMFPYLMAADIYSAVREVRPYHKEKSHEEAMAIIGEIRDIPDNIKEMIDSLKDMKGIVN